MRSLAISASALRPVLPGGALLQALGHAEVARDVRACRAARRLGAQLREPAGAEALEPRVDVSRHGEAQDDVPQEREPLVRLAALVGPRGMRERLPGQILRQLVEKGSSAWPGFSACACAWAATKSAA